MPGMKIDEALNIAISLHKAGKFAEEESIYQQILKQSPDNAESKFLLGTLNCQKGNFQLAENLIRQSLPGLPGYFAPHLNLGLVLVAMRRYEEAILSFAKALEFKPDSADAAYDIGYCYFQLKQYPKSVEAYQLAIRIDPRHALSYNQMGLALMSMGEFEKAEQAYRTSFQIRPDMYEAHSNLGGLLTLMGNHDEAIECYRKAMSLAPASQAIHSNLIMMLNNSPRHFAKEIHQEQRQWNERHAAPLAKSIKPLQVDKNPDRRLKIGFSSPDFRDHPVSRFITSLLANLDPSKFEIFAYSDHQSPDSQTQTVKNLVHQWRDSISLSFEQLADRIREDKIDILFDLAAHSSSNRLPTFAMKPAPIQISWLAYCGSTGLDAIDYRISDPLMDPQGMFDAFYSEKTLLLPDCYWCYSAPDSSPTPQMPDSNSVVFGSFNNFAKINDPLLELWARILAKTPDSKLLCFAPDGAPRKKVSAIFQATGVDPNRIIFKNHLSPADYYATYNQVHIALDSFPNNGGTTTCDALWMGVPVVSKVSKDRAIGRAGLSLLSNVGLQKLAVETDEDYARVAVELALDRARIAGLRTALRDQMRKSPLMDAPKFGKNMGDLLRSVWRKYTETTP